MTVKELINRLSEMDHDLPVRVAIKFSNDSGEIREISDITIEGNDTNDKDFDVLIEV